MSNAASVFAVISRGRGDDGVGIGVGAEVVIGALRRRRRRPREMTANTDAAFDIVVAEGNVVVVIDNVFEVCRVGGWRRRRSVRAGAAGATTAKSKPLLGAR